MQNVVLGHELEALIQVAAQTLHSDTAVQRMRVHRNPPGLRTGVRSYTIVIYQGNRCKAICAMALIGLGMPRSDGGAETSCLANSEGFWRGLGPVGLLRRWLDDLESHSATTELDSGAGRA